MRSADDVASIQVVEAVMVAILILTGMIFFTITTRPTPEPGQTGLELAGLAQDTLEYLETTNLTDPDDADVGLTMEQWVSEIVNGSARGGRVADAVEEQLELLLPGGVEGVVLLSNGLGRHVLAPELGGVALGNRAGGVGMSLVLPNWTAVAESAATQAALGADYDWSTYNCLVAPTGHNTAPQEAEWAEQWVAETGGKARVPASALLGVWAFHTDAGCADPAELELQVVRPDGTAHALAMYAVELVVWAGV